jgi:acyl-CoA thioesterase I
MNPIALYLASGESLYSGAALLLLIIAITPYIKNRWLLRLRALLIWSALALMAMACPPFPWWLDGVFFAAFLAWLIAGANPKMPPTPARRRFRLVTMAALTLLTIVLPALEFPHRYAPRFTGTRADHLVVIGDSISAGIFKDEPWPVLFQMHTNIPVANLSAAGAEASDALDQTRKLTGRDTLILIEIGGNDMIGGVASTEFETRLDKLLAACAGRGRTLIMFELPLLPHRIAYGRIQRRLADKYQVQLIPKRFFIEVLRSGTSDGLHLSYAGASHMAALVDVLLDPVLIKPVASKP